MINGTPEKPTKINPKSELKGTHAAKKKRINRGTIKEKGLHENDQTNKTLNKHEMLESHEI